MTPHAKQTSSTQVTALLDLLNNARETSKLAILTTNTTLQSCAHAHAVRLSTEGKLRPSLNRLQIPYGENLHRSRHHQPALDAFNSWSNKPYARANLLSPHAHFAGVAIVKENTYAYVVLILTETDPAKYQSVLGSVASCSVSAVPLPEPGSVSRSECISKPLGDDILGTRDSGKTSSVGVRLMSEMNALDIAQDAFNFVNGARRDADVGYLRWDDGLYRQALSHTQIIFKLGKLVHSGKRRFENVAMLNITPQMKAGKLLMQKFARRRENMLSSSFDYSAIAVVADDHKAFATQLFSRERVVHK